MASVDAMPPPRSPPVLLSRRQPFAQLMCVVLWALVACIAAPSSVRAFSNPQGVAVDYAGNLFVLNLGSNYISKVSSGIVTDQWMATAPTTLSNSQSTNGAAVSLQPALAIDNGNGLGANQRAYVLIHYYSSYESGTMMGVAMSSAYTSAASSGYLTCIQIPVYSGSPLYSGGPVTGGITFDRYNVAWVIMPGKALYRFISYGTSCTGWLTQYGLAYPYAFATTDWSNRLYFAGSGNMFGRAGPNADAGFGNCAEDTTSSCAALYGVTDYAASAAVTGIAHSQNIIYGVSGSKLYPLSNTGISTGVMATLPTGTGAYVAADMDGHQYVSTGTSVGPNTVYHIMDGVVVGTVGQASCPPPTAPANGTLGTCTSAMTTGQTCRFTCLSPYQVVGDSKCANGALYPRVPCVLASCPISPPPNAILANPCALGILKSGESCAITCSSGYTLTAGSTSYCNNGVLTVGTQWCSPFNQPQGVAADLHGNVFVLNLGVQTVSRASAGVVRQTWWNVNANMLGNGQSTNGAAIALNPVLALDNGDGAGNGQRAYVLITYYSSYEGGTMLGISASSGVTTDAVSTSYYTCIQIPVYYGSIIVGGGLSQAIGFTFDSYNVGWITINSVLFRFTSYRTSCSGWSNQYGLNYPYAFSTSDPSNRLYFATGAQLGAALRNADSGFGSCAGVSGSCAALYSTTNLAFGVTTSGGIAYYESNLYVIAGSNKVYNTTLSGTLQASQPVVTLPWGNGAYIAADLGSTFYVSTGASGTLGSNVDGFHNLVWAIAGTRLGPAMQVGNPWCYDFVAPDGASLGSCVSPMKAGDTCQMMCDASAGLTASGLSTCQNGALYPINPCVRASCSISPPPNSELTEPCLLGTLQSGHSCAITCDAGYTLTAGSTSYCNNGVLTVGTQWCSPFNQPQGVAADLHGNVFVLNLGVQTVSRASAGVVRQTWWNVNANMLGNGQSTNGAAIALNPVLALDNGDGAGNGQRAYVLITYYSSYEGGTMLGISASSGVTTDAVSTSYYTCIQIPVYYGSIIVGGGLSQAIGFTFDSYNVGWITINSVLFRFTSYRTSCSGWSNQYGLNYPYAFSTSDPSNRLYFATGAQLGAALRNADSGFGSCAGVSGSCAALYSTTNLAFGVTTSGGIAYYESNLYVIAGSNKVYNTTLSGTLQASQPVVTLPWGNGAYIAADLGSTFYVSTGASGTLGSNVDGFHNLVWAIAGTRLGPAMQVGNPWCYDFVAPDGASLGSCVSPMKAGDTCQMMCDASAGLTASGLSTCQNGALYPINPCVRASCSISPPPNSELTEPCLLGTLQSGHSCAITCDAGYTLTAGSTSYCNNGVLTVGTQWCSPFNQPQGVAADLHGNVFVLNLGVQTVSRASAGVVRQTWWNVNANMLGNGQSTNGAAIALNPVLALDNGDGAGNGQRAYVLITYYSSYEGGTMLGISASSGVTTDAVSTSYYTCIQIPVYYGSIIVGGGLASQLGFTFDQYNVGWITINQRLFRFTTYSTSCTGWTSVLTYGYQVPWLARDSSRLYFMTGAIYGRTALGTSAGQLGATQYTSTSTTQTGGLTAYGDSIWVVVGTELRRLSNVDGSQLGTLSIATAGATFVSANLNNGNFFVSTGASGTLGGNADGFYNLVHVIDMVGTAGSALGRPCSIPTLPGMLWGTCNAGAQASGSTCSIACNPYYRLDGTGTSCSNGVTLTDQTCTWTACAVSVTNGTLGAGCSNGIMPSGGTCAITCDAGFTTDGVPFQCRDTVVRSHPSCNQDCTVTAPVNSTGLGTCIGGKLKSGSSCQTNCTSPLVTTGLTAAGVRLSNAGKSYTTCLRRGTGTTDRNSDACHVFFNLQAHSNASMATSFRHKSA